MTKPSNYIAQMQVGVGVLCHRPSPTKRLSQNGSPESVLVGLTDLSLQRRLPHNSIGVTVLKNI